MSINFWQELSYWVDDKHLRCSTDAIYRLVERSELPHTRIFKRKGLRFSADEIERWARVERKVGRTEDC